MKLRTLIAISLILYVFGASTITVIGLSTKPAATVKVNPVAAPALTIGPDTSTDTETDPTQAIIDESQSITSDTTSDTTSPATQTTQTPTTSKTTTTSPVATPKTTPGNADAYSYSSTDAHPDTYASSDSNTYCLWQCGWGMYFCASSSTQYRRKLLADI